MRRKRYHAHCNGQGSAGQGRVSSRGRLGDPEDEPVPLLDPEDEPVPLLDPEDEPVLLLDPEDEPVPLLDPDDPLGPLLDPEDNFLGPLLDPEDDLLGPLLDPTTPEEHRLRLLAERHLRSRLRSDDGLLPATSVETPTREELAEPRLTSSIIVRLSPLVEPPAEPGSLFELAKCRQLEELCSVLKCFHLTKSHDSQAAVPWELPEHNAELTCEPADPLTLDDLETRAAKSDFRPRRSLKAYWRLDIGNLKLGFMKHALFENSQGGLASSKDLADELIRQLNDVTEVDRAYREVAVSDPQLETTDALAGFQHYHEDSPVGIGGRWAWRYLRNGSSVKIVDLEQGWRTDHQDLGHLGLNGRPLAGDNRHGHSNYLGDHGTAVASVIEGKADNLGVVGIAARRDPSLANRSRLLLASHFLKGHGASGDKDSRVATAITTVLESGLLAEGDLLLLEVQAGWKPVEIDDLTFDAIRLALSQGIIVIEAAGNGGLDLDQTETDSGRSFNTRSRSFRDSGAIMVGAAHAALPHNRLRSSNFGSRIDCFAWGEGIASAGYGDYISANGNSVSDYTDRFSGTSGAAAIIAGAALLVQDIFSSTTGSRLTPREMRAVLSSRLTGTRQGRGVPGAIGVMPDLKLILERRLGIVPRPYIRSSSEGNRATCSSPDIFAVANHAPSEEPINRLRKMPATSEITEICVRVKNRGLREAEKVVVSAYSTTPCTLPTPDRWQSLGEKSPSGVVPQGDTLEAFTIKVKPAQRPTAAFCLIAKLDYPSSQPLEKSSWPSFVRAMRPSNGLGIRNVYELSRLAHQEGFHFHLNGTLNRARPFEFEIRQRLPEGARLQLTLPEGLAQKLRRGRFWQVQRPNVDSDLVELVLPTQPRLPLGVVRLPAGFDVQATLRLDNNREILPGHSVAIRQLYRGREVGRIAWQKLVSIPD